MNDPTRRGLFAIVAAGVLAPFVASVEKLAPKTNEDPERTRRQSYDSGAGWVEIREPRGDAVKEWRTSFMGHPIVGVRTMGS